MEKIINNSVSYAEKWKKSGLRNKKNLSHLSLYIQREVDVNEYLDLCAKSIFYLVLEEYLKGTSIREVLDTLQNDEILGKILQDVQQNSNVFEDYLEYLTNTPLPTQVDTVVLYEKFLKQYNPKERKALGVWHTPEPIVKFMVRAVNDILMEEFGIMEGLKSSSYSLVDPATGHGNFLLEVLKQIGKDKKDLNQPELGSSILPNLQGKEISLSSFIIAKYKIKKKLLEMGIRDDLISLNLGNSLEKISELKLETPVMVVLGNPPYRGESTNKGDWIMELMDDYKSGLNEKKINLDDDYIKFIRYAQILIDRTGEGVLAYITNNSFIEGITHRRMRESLTHSFDKLYCLDLHGNARRGECTPDGTKDENVFDIMQGVSISLFVKKPGSSKKPGIIFKGDLWGIRNKKYNFLNQKNLKDIEWKAHIPQGPDWLFSTLTTSATDKNSYLSGIEIRELFGLSQNGMKTERDSVTIHLTRADIENTVNYFYTNDIDTIKAHFKLKKDSRDWTVKKAQLDIQKHYKADLYQDVLYRPFDWRYTYYTGTSKGFIGTPAQKIFHHIINNKNITLSLPRQVPDSEKAGALVSTCLTGHKVFSAYNINTVFPLYLYPDTTDQTSTITEGVQPNLNTELVEKLAASVNLTYTFDPEDLWAHGEDEKLTPLDVLDYCYAALHSPEYRETYKEFLESDFPRIPYPKDATQLRALIQSGSRLRKLHLLEDAGIDNYITTYPMEGSNEVSRKMTTKSIGWEATTGGLGRVWINDEQYFDKVPLTAWEFYIGGYQPAQKWLKDRHERVLSFDDILHYQRIIVALEETRKVMQEIDVIGLL